MSAGTDAAPPPSGTERCGGFETCGILLRSGTALSCGGCGQQVYCSKACQRADWKRHKVECRERQRERAKVAAAVPTLTGAPPPFGLSLAAARAGDAAAQYNVAVAYNTGTGVAQSFLSAFEWLTRCAARPSPPREVWALLGVAYEHGRGVAKDEEEAVRLYRVGAAADDAEAQKCLACCFAQGIGCEHNFDEAFAMYTAAAAQDHAEAILALGACFGEGRGVARDLPRSIALLKRVLAHPRAHLSTVALATRNLGQAYWVGGDGVPRDAVLTARYWRQAAAAGDVSAARCLRECGLA